MNSKFENTNQNSVLYVQLAKSGIVHSKSDAKRLIAIGKVKVNNSVIDNPLHQVNCNDTIEIVKK